MQIEAELYDYAVYLSHSPEDTPLAHEMVRAIQFMGLSVWPPPVTQQLDEEWIERIKTAIENSETFLFLVTPNTKFSNWMNFELGAAVGRATEDWDIRIRPILVGDVSLVSLPPFLRKAQPLWLESGSPEEIARRLAISLMKAGSSNASA